MQDGRPQSTIVREDRRRAAFLNYTFWFKGREAISPLDVIVGFAKKVLSRLDTYKGTEGFLAGLASVHGKLSRCVQGERPLSRNDSRNALLRKSRRCSLDTQALKTQIEKLGEHSPKLFKLLSISMLPQVSWWLSGSETRNPFSYRPQRGLPSQWIWRIISDHQRREARWWPTSTCTRWVRYPSKSCKRVSITVSVSNITKDHVSSPHQPRKLLVIIWPDMQIHRQRWYPPVRYEIYRPWRQTQRSALLQK